MTEWEGRWGACDECGAENGLFIFVYHAQHPSLCKPWLRAIHSEWMCEIFEEDKTWRSVIAWLENGTGRQRAVSRMKECFADAPETPAIGETL